MIKKIKFLIFGLGDGSNEVEELINSNYENFIIKKTKSNYVKPISYDKAILSFGDPHKRAKVFYSLSKKSLKFLTLVDKYSYVSSSSKIGKGSIISPNVTVGYNVKIGKNCYIGANCSIAHDVIIREHCVISPGSIIGGGAIIGNRTFLGLGSVIVPRLKIGNCSKVSANEVLFKNLPSNCTFIGNRIIKN